ncbi:MAG TPA: outer membrane lipoprotein-sorting protein [Terrimicrobiaceae bacterium]
MIFRITAAVVFLASLLCAHSAEPASPVLSATNLASRLSDWQQDGASYVRLRMEIKQPPGITKSALQIQIKARRTSNSTDVLYQILWPKERKGEAVLLRKAGDGSLSGWTFVPPDTVRALDASQMAGPLFGSDLSYEDLAENFFAWPNQNIVGTDQVDGVSCQVLESRPGKGVRSSFASVRSWVDSRRLIPLRIEKYKAAGRVVRRIDTANVVTDDIGRQIPANLRVSGSQNSVTEIDGSRIKHDVTYADRQFTPEALREVTIPRSSAE